MPDDTLYASYDRFKGYVTPTLGAKLQRRLDREVWRPGNCTTRMSFLEVGCGTGEILLYLRAKGVSDFLGIDRDPNLARVIPETVRDHFRVVDAETFASSEAGLRRFDRILMFDVLEHFPPSEVVDILRTLDARLNPNGRIIVKVPNAGSPWGARYQYGDLTHRAAFTPGSLRQAAVAAGLVCESCYAQRRGTRFRLAADALLHWGLSKILLTPPELWSANMYAVFRTTKPDALP